MLLQNGKQAAFDLCKSVIPTHLQPLITPAHHRLTNTIPVNAKFLEAIGFWTNVAMTENILFISPNREHLTPARHDLQSAGRLTKWTCRVAGLCLHHCAFLSPLPTL